MLQGQFRQRSIFYLSKRKMSQIVNKCDDRKSCCQDPAAEMIALAISVLMNLLHNRAQPG